MAKPAHQTDSPIREGITTLPRTMRHANSLQIVQNDFTFPMPPILASQPVSSQETNAATSSQDSTNKENAAPPPNLTRYPPQIQILMTSIISTLHTLFTKYPPHTIQRFAELLLAPKQHYKTLPSYLHALDRVVHVTSGAHTFPLPPAIPEPSSLTILSNGTSLTAGKDPLSISWGNPASNPSASSLGSDESLGGALLTPITWLQKNGGSTSPLEGEVRTESTETIDGPNGPGGVETVSVSVNGISSTTSPAPSSSGTESGDLAAALRAEGGITQGELLRQEQKAGVVPAAQLIGKGDESGMGEEDELPHARGPEEIGMEDMGPQHQAGSATERMTGNVGMQGIDVEAAVGRRIAPKPDPSTSSASASTAKSDAKEEEEKAETPTTPKREAEDELTGEGKKAKVDSTEGVTPEPVAGKTDIEIVDADGKTEDEPKVGEKGENKGGDAVDMTSV
jgi:hypothetical protein